MSILITGASGLLGTALVEKLSKTYDIIGFSRRKEFNSDFKLEAFISADITDRAKVKNTILDYSPNIVIHTAALSDVDLCEKEPELAYQVNVRGTENMALACQGTNILFIYISTDYVFDGKSQEPYRESDISNPINVYGRTKLEGEEKVRSILKKYLIIRTAWLFGSNGNSFVEHIKEKVKAEKTLDIVNDKFSSPTYTKDLTQAISKLIDIIFKNNNDKLDQIYGTYHITNSGSASWFNWAKEILKDLEIKEVEINPIGLEQLKLAAERPKMTVLDKSRYINLTNQPLRRWEEALKDYLENI